MNSKSKKIAVITGATGGIGREIAALLLDAGMKLYLVGRDFEDLRSHLDLSGDNENNDVYFCKANFNIEGKVKKVFNFVDEDKIDFLIHCAAHFDYGAFEDADISDLDKSYRVNLKAPYLLNQKLLPKLTKGNGVIAFLNSSLVIGSGKENLLHYASTKSALKAMADCLRQEVNSMGIRVVTIILGKVATSMQEKACDHEGISYKPDKMVHPKEVAKLIWQALSAPDSMEITNILIRPSESYH